MRVVCVHVYRPVLAMYRLCIMNVLLTTPYSLAALEVVRVGFTIQDVGRVRGHLHPVHAVLETE